MANDSKTLPIIGTIPVLQPVDLPTMLNKPPKLILFETCTQNIVPEQIDLHWLNDASITTTLTNNIGRVSYLEENRLDINGINQYATIGSNKLMNRLHPFLRTRIPVQRNDLLPGRHWVWDSFRIK